MVALIGMADRIIGKDLSNFLKLGVRYTRRHQGGSIVNLFGIEQRAYLPNNTTGPKKTDPPYYLVFINT